jgi:hypothetical protein
MTIVADRDLATSWNHARVRTQDEAAATQDADRTVVWRWAYLAPWFAVCAAGAYVRCVAAEIRRPRRTPRTR